VTKTTFDVLQSSKAGLSSRESYIVTRGRTSFLRILGADPQWDLMTATVSEDQGRIKVCSDQLRLVESALRLGAELETSPSVHKDWAGREYAKICAVTQSSNQNDREFNNKLYAVFSRFFEIYDACTDLKSRPKAEMIDLYNDLAADDLGGDIYLSDGLWLSNDGSIHDRGR
jgi:hypothetical protein